jgi:uncharacterized repeat protein (TIGR03803 family)
MKLATIMAAALLVAFTAQLHAASDVTAMHVFTGGKDGAFPDSNLAMDAAGNFYGTTQIGGADGAGTIFELTPTPGG